MTFLPDLWLDQYYSRRRKKSISDIDIYQTCQTSVLIQNADEWAV